MKIPPVEGQEIQDLGSHHNYRTEIPNIIFTMKLDPWAFKAYCVFKMTAGDKSACFKSNNTLSEEIGCSIPTLIKLKNELRDHGLINIMKRKHPNGGDMPDLIQIIDIWPQNAEYMLKLYPKNPKNELWPWKKGGCKPDLGGGVNAVKGGSKRRLDKQDHNEQEQKEQQQAKPVLPAAVVPLASPKKKNEKPLIWPELESIDIAVDQKKEITRDYSREKVQHGVKYVTHPKTVITKGLLQALKWACRVQPELPIDKTPREEMNKAYAMKYDGNQVGGAIITACNKHIELVNGPLVFALTYDSKDFMDKFTEQLRKNRIPILEA